MTMLSQTWSVPSFSNIIPTFHTSDVTLDRAKLIYGIIMKMDMNLVMQSYPARALDRKLQVDWARDAREGPRVLMSLRVDFGPMG